MKKISAKDLLGLFGWLALSFAVMVIGVSFSPGMSWYDTLRKPTWTPPPWVFGPVWTFLYISMAVAAWRIWTRGGFYEHCSTLSVYLLQLFLNALWSPLFFGLHMIFIALIDLALLWVVLISTTILFFQKDRIAGYLMIPYLIWTTFALALNYTIFMLNGG